MFTIVATLTLNADQTIFTLPNGWRPQQNVYSDDLVAGLRLYIEPSGRVVAFGAGKSYALRVSSCFIC